MLPAISYKSKMVFQESYLWPTNLQNSPFPLRLRSVIIYKYQIVLSKIIINYQNLLLIFISLQINLSIFFRIDFSSNYLYCLYFCFHLSNIYSHFYNFSSFLPNFPTLFAIFSFSSCLFHLLKLRLALRIPYSIILTLTSTLFYHFCLLYRSKWASNFIFPIRYLFSLISSAFPKVLQFLSVRCFVFPCFVWLLPIIDCFYPTFIDFIASTIW